MSFVYSTNKDFRLEKNEEEQETLSNEKQILKLRYESKGRSGKPVTIISNFIGKDKDLELLAKEIKNFCATGGSIKEGEILIQGDLKDKIKIFLDKKGYKTKG